MNNFDRAEKTCYDRLKRAKKDTKTDREIELEKEIDRLSARNAKFEKKLEIAVRALKFYANENNFAGESSLDYVYEKHPTSDCIDDFCDMGWYAQQALKEIEGCGKSTD